MIKFNDKTKVASININYKHWMLLANKWLLWCSENEVDYDHDYPCVNDDTTFEIYINDNDSWLLFKLSWAGDDIKI